MEDGAAGFYLDQVGCEAPLPTGVTPLTVACAFRSLVSACESNCSMSSSVKTFVWSCFSMLEGKWKVELASVRKLSQIESVDKAVCMYSGRPPRVVGTI